MKSTLLTLVAGASLVMAPAMMAQGHGGHGGGGGGGGQSGLGRPQMSSAQGSGRQAGTPQGIGTGDRDQIRQRDRIHVNDQQRDRLRDCINSADQTRSRARDMQKLAKSNKFNTSAAIQQRDRLQQQLRTMDQQHQQLMNQLSQQQRDGAQERIRAMEEARHRVNTRMQEMNGELAQSNPDRNKVQQQARDVERSMQQWREQYQQMESDD